MCDSTTRHLNVTCIKAGLFLWVSEKSHSLMHNDIGWGLSVVSWKTMKSLNMWHKSCEWSHRDISKESCGNYDPQIPRPM